MKKNIIEIVTEKGQSCGLRTFTAIGKDGVIMGPSCDIRTLAISLSCEMAARSSREQCEFVVIDKMGTEQFSYEITNLKRNPPGKYELKVLCKNLPPPRTTSRKFYNWLSGKSRPRSA